MPRLRTPTQYQQGLFFKIILNKKWPVLSISDCTESNVMTKGENNVEIFGSKLSWPKWYAIPAFARKYSVKPRKTSGYPVSRLRLDAGTYERGLHTYIHTYIHTYMHKETTLSYKGSLECPVKSIITEARYIRGRIILLFKISLIIILLYFRLF